MRLLLSYIRRYKKIVFGALALATINNFFSLLDPQIFRLLIDNYARRAAELTRTDFFYGILLLLLASVGVAFVSRVAKNFQDYFVSMITQRVGARLYGEGVAHSFSLPYAVFEDQRSGEHLQKLQKARLDSQAFITSSFNIVFFSVVGIVFVLIYAFYVHWAIGLLYFLLIPAIGATTFFISKKIKRAQRIIVKESAALAGSTTETLRNVELVKSLGLERQETDRLNRVNEQILGFELNKIKHIRVLSFVQGTLVNAMRSLLLLTMLWLIFTKSITIGEFFSLYIYSFFIFSPLQEFGNVVAQYQEAKASMEQLETILNVPPEQKPAHPASVIPLRSIEFRKVSFTYPSAESPSVRDVSLSVEAGETVAFVGPSGSGKSTLVKLIAGLYQPARGTLFFNDTPAEKVNYATFRAKIGLVSQETQLFAGTVRENLLFVNPDASDADCLRVLRLASAMPIIERGGEGLNTKIGEGGIKISGGERQRLAIARALLRKPELIIFDEATSSLDSITEKAITETIEEIDKGDPHRISILVAHRLSTVAHADRIYVIERGRIIEKGAHEELLTRGGLYAALWREQIGG